MKKNRNIIFGLIIIFLLIAEEKSIFASEITLISQENNERCVNLKVNSDIGMEKIYLYKKNSDGRYTIFMLVNAQNKNEFDCRISMDKLSSASDTEIKVVAIQDENNGGEKTITIPKFNSIRTPIPSISISPTINSPKASNKGLMTTVKPSLSFTPTPTSKSTPTPTASTKQPKKTTSTPTPTSNQKPTDTGKNTKLSTEDEARDKIAKVAENEYKNNHHTNGKKYYQKLFHKKSTVAKGGWCSEFVAWCGNECGYIDAGIFPKCSSSDDVINFFKKHPGKFVKSRSYKPKKGDILITNDGEKHTSLVVGVSGSKVTYIQGGGSSVRKRTIKIGNGKIYGYGVPDYSKLSK